MRNVGPRLRCLKMPGVALLAVVLGLIPASFAAGQACVKACRDKNAWVSFGLTGSFCKAYRDNLTSARDLYDTTGGLELGTVEVLPQVSQTHDLWDGCTTPCNTLPMVATPGGMSSDTNSDFKRVCPPTTGYVKPPG